MPRHTGLSEGAAAAAAWYASWGGVCEACEASDRRRPAAASAHFCRPDDYLMLPPTGFMLDFTLDHIPRAGTLTLTFTE